MVLSPGECYYVKIFLQTLLCCLTLLYFNDISVRNEDIQNRKLHNG